MKRILLGLALVLGVAGAAVAVYAQDGFGGPSRRAELRRFEHRL
jgi:hypothetical protein